MAEAAAAGGGESSSSGSPPRHRDDDVERGGAVPRGDEAWPRSPLFHARTIAGAGQPAHPPARAFRERVRARGPRPRGRWPGATVSAGPFYVDVRKPASAARGATLGLDLSLRDLTAPAQLLRAVFAEFLASIVFLFIVLSNVCYRRFFAGSVPGTRYEGVFDPGQLRAIDYTTTLGAGAQLMIASSFGFTIFVLVFLIAPISGGHINPAITLGLALARRITLLRGVLYVAAQCGGAILGALLSKSMSSEEWVRVGGGVLGSHHFGWGPQLGAEFIATALLVLTVFAAVEPGRALAPRYSSVLAPFAIGMAVFVAHLALIPITGTGINPARALGSAVARSVYYKHWIFWVGPMAGGAFAAVCWELALKQYSDDAAPPPPADL